MSQFSFGAAGREHGKSIYNDAGFLLSLAVADNAPFGKSLDDVRNMDLLPSETELILKYNGDTINRPILQKCTKAYGATGGSWARGSTTTTLRRLLRSAVRGQPSKAKKTKIGASETESYEDWDALNLGYYIRENEVAVAGISNWDNQLLRPR
ncbi:hypothetical protein V8E54_011112 [Elaphomyces granulatus]